MVAQDPVKLIPGTLWQDIVRRTEHAIRCGALHSIGTECGVIEQSGVRFLVRSVSSLARKQSHSAGRQTDAKPPVAGLDPFLPYDEDLFIADISQTHVCLLNKFNVIDHHLLVVTRGFEHQETLVTLADFEALWACMAEFDGLGFYNGGNAAGASQPHKHLQIVPLPLANAGPPIPIEPLLVGEGLARTIEVAAKLPFVHAFARLDPALAGWPLDAAKVTHKLYHALLEAVGVHPIGVGEQVRQSAPYNLLITRRWMLMVPRSREFFGPISINALGFAGSLFVGDPRQVDIVRDRGPMNVLRHVAIGRAAD